MFASVGMKSAGKADLGQLANLKGRDATRMTAETVVGSFLQDDHEEASEVRQSRSATSPRTRISSSMPPLVMTARSRRSR